MYDIVPVFHFILFLRVTLAQSRHRWSKIRRKVMNIF